MSFSKQKTITVTIEDYIDRNAVGHAEFTDKDGKPCLVQVVPDEDCESPRRVGEPLWTWVTTCGAGYSDNENETPKDFEDDDGKIDEAFCKENLIRPLYLLRHSGDFISVSNRECRAFDPQGFDSGCMGFAYLNKEKARKEYGWKMLTEGRVNQLLKYLQREVEEVNAYLSGEVYGVKVINLETEHEESCWNFICPKWKDVEETVREMLGGWVETHAERDEIAKMVA
jgi:hypothetical protein